MAAAHRRRRDEAAGPAHNAEPPREGFEIGDVLWPWFIGLQLAEVGRRSGRIHRTPDANLTLTGDDQTGGEVGHPAARVLGAAVFAAQILLLVPAILFAATAVIAPIRGVDPDLVISAILADTFGASPQIPTAVFVALTIGSLPILLEGALILKSIPAILALTHRVRQLRAAGEAVCVMTSYVRRKNTSSAGQALATPVMEWLGDRRVITLGNAANRALVPGYLRLGATHDTRTGKPGWHRRMRFDYSGRDASY